MLRLLFLFIVAALVFLLLRRALELWKIRRIQPPVPDISEPLVPGNYTVEDRLVHIGSAARMRLIPFFQRAGIAYPPEEVLLIGFKEEKVLDVLARAPGGEICLVRTYPILAASGGPGPKLREGDRQVPEGLYEIEALNPNSKYHLALRLNYPSPTDLLRAGEDDRDPETLGGDIMIHGRAASSGCLAIGDLAIEELFTLAADTGIERMRVLLVPCDLRVRTPGNLAPGMPAWVPELHVQLRRELEKYPLPATIRR